MPYEIIAAICVGVIALLLLLMKTNAGVVFFSVCAGSVLATQLGSEASLISSTVIKDGDINKSFAYILLVTIPALLSALFLRGSISTGKALFNIAPSVAVGALLILLVIPLLPPGISSEILQSELWKQLQQFQPLILVGGVISSIVLLWFTHQKSKKDKKKHKK